MKPYWSDGIRMYFIGSVVKTSYDVLWYVIGNKRVIVTCNWNARVYRCHGSDPLDPRYLKSTVKHPDSRMVWGCFSGLGLGKFVVLPKNLKMEGNVYLELLADHLPESIDLCSAKILQQDGAPAHTAKSVTVTERL